MTFVDLIITRRHFAARYNQVGRCMLADLAEIFGISFNLAEHWADEIDRETHDQIAAARRPLGSDNAGAGSCPRPAPASPQT